MYLAGQGVKQDSAEAVRWYRLAADKGYAIAQHNLGSIHSNGRYLPQDYVEAAKWFQLAVGFKDTPVYCTFSCPLRGRAGRAARPCASLYVWPSC